MTEPVYKNIGNLYRNDARKRVDDVLHEMSTVLEQGETSKLRGLGTFKLRAKRERIGRNPKNGVGAVATPRRMKAFKAFPVLVAKLNRLEPLGVDEAE